MPTVNSSITFEEIIAAIQTATRQTPDAKTGGITVTEMSTATGWSTNRVRAALMLLKKAGRLGVSRVSRERIDGMMTLVSAYKITAKAKNK